MGEIDILKLILLNFLITIGSSAAVFLWCKKTIKETREELLKIAKNPIRSKFK